MMEEIRRIDITVWPQTGEVAVHKHITEDGSDGPVHVVLDDHELCDRTEHRLTAEVERLEGENERLRAKVVTERGYRQTAARLLGQWETQSDEFADEVGLDYFEALRFLLTALDASDALRWSGDNSTFERIARQVGYLEPPTGTRAEGEARE